MCHLQNGMQLSEKEAELGKLQRANEGLRLEKQALQNDAMQLSDRQMQLTSANRMLANELQEQQRGLGTVDIEDQASETTDGDAALSLERGGSVGSSTATGGIGSKTLKPKRSAMEGKGKTRAVGARGKGKRLNVIDIRDYEEVVAELAHRKLEIACGQVCASTSHCAALSHCCSGKAAASVFLSSCSAWLMWCLCLSLSLARLLGQHWHWHVYIITSRDRALFCG
jgi:hypothetical protein